MGCKDIQSSRNFTKGYIQGIKKRGVNMDANKAYEIWKQKNEKAYEEWKQKNHEAYVEWQKKCNDAYHEWEQECKSAYEEWLKNTQTLIL